MFWLSEKNPCLQVEEGQAQTAEEKQQGDNRTWTKIKSFVVFFFSRVISRAPGLKLVVETLISSLRPIGNIVLICCAFFIIFGILGVQVEYFPPL